MIFRFSSWKCVWNSSLIISLALLGGCQDASAPNAVKSGNAVIAEETWDVCYIQDSRVGHVHTVIKSLERNGQSLVQSDMTNELTLKRFGEPTIQRMSVTCVETLAGELLQCSCRVTAGREETVAEGEVRENQLVLKTITPGKTDETKMTWKKSFGGYFASEQSMRKQPLKPGEIRSIKTLMPIVNSLGDVRLEALDYEDTKLLNESRRLLKVRKTDLIGQTKFDTYLWADESGDALKSYIPGMELYAYRTTKDKATAIVETVAYDLGENTIVRVTRRLRDAHASEKIVYRAKLKNGEIENVFARGASQIVKAIDKSTAELTVLAIRPQQPPSVNETEEVPNEDDLASNNYIQCDDLRIVAMARQLAPEDADAWTVAKAAESHVKQVIRTKNFSQALATASEVAKSLEGDCTEHSVLLAALCRARKIPARVAVGLVYYRPQNGFAYHMWNEVWISDRWVPLDSTLGLGGIGGAHLKLGTSSLKGADAVALFLPVANVIGNLELEVMEVQP